MESRAADNVKKAIFVEAPDFQIVFYGKWLSAPPSIIEI